MTHKNIPEARLIELDGSEKIVQPKGYPLNEGNIYYEPRKHRGHLKCVCCDADMEFRRGKDIAGGSSGVGQNAHFVPRKKHDEGCDYRPDRPARERYKTDRAKGWRIHIDTRDFSADFNDQSGVYKVASSGHLVKINDPDLRDREIYKVEKIDDVLGLMTKGEPERLKDSKIIFNNRARDWLDTFALLERPDRYRRLVDHAIENPCDVPFEIMHIRVTKGYSSGRAQPPFGSVTLPAASIPYGRDKRGKYREIVPSAEVCGRLKAEILRCFSDEGDYLVMGLVRHKTFVGDHKTIEYLNVTVNHPDQIRRVDMGTLEKEARVAMENRRERGSKPAPSGP